MQASGRIAADDRAPNAIDVDNDDSSNRYLRVENQAILQTQNY